MINNAAIDAKPNDMSRGGIINFNVRCEREGHALANVGDALLLRQHCHHHIALEQRPWTRVAQMPSAHIHDQLALRRLRGRGRRGARGRRRRRRRRRATAERRRRQEALAPAVLVDRHRNAAAWFHHDGHARSDKAI